MVVSGLNLTVHLSAISTFEIDEVIQVCHNRAVYDPVTVQVDPQLPAKTVSHALYPVQQHLKTSLLKEILNRTRMESVLVFTRTKHRAERVAQQLIRAGYRVTSLQGDLPQNRRQAALEGFRDGSIKILVATDIAARGLDVLSISHVINYDMPESTDAYIHRIGRTGRVEKNGSAITLVTDADAEKISALERLLDAPLARLTLAGFDYARPAPDRQSGLSGQPGWHGVGSRKPVRHSR